MHTPPATRNQVFNKKQELVETVKLKLTWSNCWYKITLCNEGDQQSPSTCARTRWDRKPLPLGFSTLQPPDLSADEAPATERSFPLPQHPSHSLLLGHCQPTKQSFQQADKGWGWGARTEWGAQGCKQQKSRNPFLLAPQRAPFQSPWPLHDTPGKPTHSTQGTRRQEGTCHPALSRYKTILNFLDFCLLLLRLAHCLWGPVQNHSTFLHGQASQRVRSGWPTPVQDVWVYVRRH